MHKEKRSCSSDITAGGYQSTTNYVTDTMLESTARRMECKAESGDNLLRIEIKSLKHNVEMLQNKVDRLNDDVKHKVLSEVDSKLSNMKLNAFLATTFIISGVVILITILFVLKHVVQT